MSEASVFLKIAAKYLNPEELKKLKTDLGDVKQATQSWWDVMKGILAADILKSIANQVISFAKDCVKAFLESEEAVNRLTVALKNNGSYTKELQEEYIRFSKELQANTKYTDEQVISVMSLLSVYGVMGNELEATTKAVLDLSTSQRIDLNAATVMLGKAYEGNTLALKKMGIEVQLTGDRSKDFEKILEAINKRSGGSAAAELNTFAGQWTNLKNIWSEFMEKIGEKMVPYLEKVVGFLKYAGEYFGLIVKMPEELSMATKEEVENLIYLKREYGLASDEYVKYRAQLVAISATKKRMAKEELDQASALAREIERNRIITENTKMSAEKLGSAFSEAFASATRSGMTFNESLSAGLEAAGQEALKIMKGILIKMLTGWYETIMAKAIIETIDTKGATAWKLPMLTAEFVAGLAAINVAIPYAKGGIITQPTVALMGEAGPEAVIPLSGQNGLDALSGMGNVNVSINAGMFVGNKVTAMETAKMIGDLLIKAKSKGVINKI